MFDSSDIVIQGRRNEPDLTLPVLSGAVRAVGMLSTACTLEQFVALIGALETVWTVGSRKQRYSEQQPLEVWSQAWLRLKTGIVDVQAASASFYNELRQLGTGKDVPVFKRWCQRVSKDASDILVAGSQPLSQQTASALVEAAVSGGRWVSTGALQLTATAAAARWVGWLSSNWQNAENAGMTPNAPAIAADWQQAWMSGDQPGTAWFASRPLVSLIAQREVPGFGEWLETTSRGQLPDDAVRQMPRPDPYEYQANVSKAFAELSAKHFRSLARIRSFPRPL